VAEELFTARFVKNKMILKLIQLENFRSFKKREFKFSFKTCFLLGPNTAGKTNVLEAIYLLASGKSFRASQDTEMIKYESEFSRVKGKIEKDELEIILTRGEINGKRTNKKLYKINNTPKRLPDFLGSLRAVLFKPEDINLVLGSPSIRRDYLNLILEQLDWQYRTCLSAYNKGLRQRNKVLSKIREGEAKESQLTFWNQLLIKNGQIINQTREIMIIFYNKQFKDTEIIYDKSPITLQRLEKYKQAELALGMTLVGPHRDDFKFLKHKANGRKDLSLYGSRGEQRLAVLYLKLAELKFVIQKTNQKPILLLDDIFSELDKKNRKLVIKIINDYQTIITNTGEEIDKDIKKEIKDSLFIKLNIDN